MSQKSSNSLSKENISYSDPEGILALGCGKKFIDSIIIDKHEVRSTDCLKLLGVCIDNNLRLDEHISSISKKSVQQVGLPMRLRNLIPT